jgi:hypothetical protein
MFTLSVHSNTKTNSTILKLVNENLLCCTRVRRRQHMRVLHSLNKNYHVLLVSSCVCTDYGTSSVLLKIRIRSLKSYPHCVITRYVKKEVPFRKRDEISIHFTKWVRTRNGCDIFMLY